MSTVLLVVAKAPVAGLAKTRLCPPATPRQAAQIAAASLLDTLHASQGRLVVTAITGRLADAERGDELRAALAGTTLLYQRGASFADRLANAHADTAASHPGAAVLQVGMDTPQLTPSILDDAVATLGQSTVDAVLGPATDGGWWALGLRNPLAANALRMVPMSRSDTGAHTLSALHDRGLNVQLLPELSDVDTMTDAERVAAENPATRFAAAVRTVTTLPIGDAQ